MAYNLIDPYQKLNKLQLFQLFWFVKMIINKQNPNSIDYIKDFHVTESLIYQFNMLVTNPNNNEAFMNDVEHCLLSYGLVDISRADAVNVCEACSYDMTMFSSFAMAYVNWKNWFYDAYDTNYYYQSKPVIWDFHRKHNEYTITQLERGAIMESFIDNEFKRNGVDIGIFCDPTGQNEGESRLGIEIKHDMRSEITGNYYIEYCENHGGDNFVPSGILKDDNTVFWVIGTPGAYEIVRKDDLKHLLFCMNSDDAGWQDDRKFACNRSSKGFIIKKSKLREIAVAHSVEEFVSKFFTFSAVA